MTLPNFDNLKTLSATDPAHQWGDPSKIDHVVLRKVDLLSETVGTRLVITSGFRPQNAGSQHALGLALDIMAPDYVGSLYDLYQAAETLGFKGLGVYPHWRYSGRTIGGLHVDERIADKPARWMGVLINHKQEYIALDHHNLKQYGVLPCKQELSSVR